jgi:hypothetical protein
MSKRKESKQQEPAIVGSIVGSSKRAKISSSKNFENASNASNASTIEGKHNIKF